MMRRSQRAAGIATLALAACSAPAEDTSEAASGETGSQAGAQGATSGDPVGLDAGTGGGDGGSKSGCTAVDVLFVIDNSGSMCTYQAGLASAFPSFVDAMYGALPAGTDLHVGITTSGFALGGSHSESNCVPQEPVSTLQSYYVKPTDGQVAGNGLQGRLFEHDGKAYYAADTGDAASKEALKGWFTGAATSVGCGVSSFEFNASGAAYALHPVNAPHNAGFLRDAGAVLLIVILSDEADQSFDVDDPVFLHDTVTQAKAQCGGDACVISAGLLSAFCTPAQSASYAFLAGFGEDPVWGDIMGGNIINPDTAGYSKVVGDALAQVVGKTCDELEPPK